MANIELGIRDIYDDIDEMINKKMRIAYKMIGRAKWKHRLNTSHRRTQTFGRWNKQWTSTNG